VKIKWAVGIELGARRVADGVAGERIGDLETLRVIQGPRPQGADQRQFILVEKKDIYER
jgi:hypothetical protein